MQQWKKKTLVLHFVLPNTKICYCGLTLFAKINSCNLRNCVVGELGGAKFKVIYDMAWLPNNKYSFFTSNFEKIKKFWGRLCGPSHPPPTAHNVPKVETF